MRLSFAVEGEMEIHFKQLRKDAIWNGRNGIKSRQSNVKNQEVGKQHGCHLRNFLPHRF